MRRGIPRAWLRRGPRAVEVREDDAAEDRRAAKRVAVAFGWCSSCGATVGDDGLHAWDCPDVGDERRAARP